MLCRQIFQIAPRKHLTMIDELFWLSTLFHWMVTVEIARRSTRCEFCSISGGLTSVLYKVFERIIFRCLFAWGGQQRLFHFDHFGFLRHRDTALALATFLNDNHKGFLQKYHSIAACLDIKSAYDSVCPEFLDYKLTSLGVGGKKSRFISNLTHFHQLKIQWKLVRSGSSPLCTMGSRRAVSYLPFRFHFH